MRKRGEKVTVEQLELRALIRQLQVVAENLQDTSGQLEDHVKILRGRNKDG